MDAVIQVSFFFQFVKYFFKFFNPIIRFLQNKVIVFNKLFSDLYYSQELSTFTARFNVIDLEESIVETVKERDVYE